MTIIDAIKHMEHHIKWRTGEELEIIEPSVLTEAEKMLVEYAKERLKSEPGLLSK